MAKIELILCEKLLDLRGKKILNEENTLTAENTKIYAEIRKEFQKQSINLPCICVFLIILNI